MKRSQIRKFLMPEVLFGSGSRKLAGQYARNLGIVKALVVTDPQLIALGWAEDVTASLAEHGVDCILFDQVTANPRDYEVMTGAERYRLENCNGIVAIGGGSPMDCAKGIGIVSSNHQDILDFIGADKIAVPLPPMICIPTTAGSSSDVSQFSIILNSKEKVKRTIISKAILPDISLIDPEITATMPPELTAATGMDALVHAMEAYVSKGSSYLTDIHALEAIRLIKRFLPLRLSDPVSIEAQEKMMLASMLAGLAFSNAILGAVHAMAHSLGGFLDLPHGECNAILLEHVVRVNYDAVPERYDAIAAAMGIEMGREALPERKELLLAGIVALRKEVGIVKSLRDVGVKAADIPILARKAYEDPCLLTNPHTLAVKDLEALYEKSL